MGKSYKRTPIVKDNGNGKKRQKRCASHRVRSLFKNQDNIVQGNLYKRCYESYNISDFVCRWTREQAIEDYNSGKEWIIKEFPTLESWLEYWEKCMKRK